MQKLTNFAAEQTFFNSTAFSDITLQIEKGFRNIRGFV
jgi:hypothetical protein